METIVVTASAPTSWWSDAIRPDMTSRIRGGVAVASLTFLGLLAVKALTYWSLVWSASVTSQVRRRLRHDVGTAERGVTSGDTSTYTSDAVAKLQWYLSDLPGDVIVYVTQLVLALYCLHGTALPDAPFVGTEAFVAVETILYYATGNIAFRLVTSFLEEGWRCGFKISALHNALALTMYIAILATRQDALLGVVAMVTSFYLLLTSVNRITHHRYCECGGGGGGGGEGRAGPAVVSGWLRVVAVAAFGCVIPTVYITLALATRRSRDMSYFSCSLFIIAVAFYGISNLYTLKLAITNAMETSGSDVTGRNHERAWLLGDRQRIGHETAAAQDKPTTDQTRALE